MIQQKTFSRRSTSQIKAFERNARKTKTYQCTVSLTPRAGHEIINWCNQIPRCVQGTTVTTLSLLSRSSRPGEDPPRIGRISSEVPRHQPLQARMHCAVQSVLLINRDLLHHPTLSRYYYLWPQRENALHFSFLICYHYTCPASNLTYRCAGVVSFAIYFLYSFISNVKPNC